MKDNLHPDYHQITVVMTDGSEFVTRSTYGQAGAELHLDIDPKVHPAWTGLHRMVDRGGRAGQVQQAFRRSYRQEGGCSESAAPAAPAEKIKLTTGASSAKKSKQA